MERPASSREGAIFWEYHLGRVGPQEPTQRFRRPACFLANRRMAMCFWVSALHQIDQKAPKGRVFDVAQLTLEPLELMPILLLLLDELLG